MARTASYALSNIFAPLILEIGKAGSLNSLIKCGDMYLHKTVLKSVMACYVERSETSGSESSNSSETYTVTLECKNNVHYALISFNSKPEAQDWLTYFVENVLNQYV